MRHPWIIGMLALAAVLMSAPGWAFQPQNAVTERAFFKSELRLSPQNEPLEAVRGRMAASAIEGWERLFARHGPDFHVYIDPKSGLPTSIQGAVPLLPGSGIRNEVTLDSLGRMLGREVKEVDAGVVADAVVQFIIGNQEVIGVELAQLDEPRVMRITPTLWQVSIPQQLSGIPVRHGRIAATLSHGNLILLGTETWQNARVPTQPGVSSEEALVAGMELTGLAVTPSQLWKAPTLEIIPYEPADLRQGDTFTGPLGQGYAHRLAWVYGFQLPGEQERWEVVVDAMSGEVLALEDRNHHFEAWIVGGVYPMTNTGVCPTPETCGTLQPGAPMPWTNTGMAAPDNFTDGAGSYNYSSGTATTTLNGRYFKIVDGCGAINVSSAAGNIDMGGANGDHDCTSGGGSAGNTAAARTAFYELNRIAALARGWLPDNTWLQSQVTANVNFNSTCSAFYNGNTLNFYRSGGGCRNTGEVAAVLDHEWGHGLDDFDVNGVMSNSSEGYADIAAIYRSQASCIGWGFFTSDRGCGPTADGTGYNANEAQTGSAHCNLNCSGVRDADWDRHADRRPDTPQNFVCTQCSSGTGPCGRQVHCAAAPARQAAWDLVARDLRGAPFNYDSNTAFLIGNKLFYQGSGNIGVWHSCDCTAGTSNGCGATNAYMQWLAADDDNGNLNDGTPHMTAIHSAFARHNIACGTPAPANNGCTSGPAVAPTASISASNGQVSLSWSSVSGASSYWVMKTEGHAGCSFGKARAATVSGTSYTDTEVLNGRQYCYNIVGAGTSSACFSPASNCVCITPPGECTPPVAPSLTSPSNGATGLSTSPVLDWSDLASGTTYEVQVATDPGFTNVVRSVSSLGLSTWTVSPELSPNTTYYWRVSGRQFCGAGQWSQAWSFTTQPAACSTTLASYDLLLKAPGCASNVCACDAGSQVDSRDTLPTKPEPNQPNTLGGTCPDGTSGNYHVDESIDQLSIRSGDGLPLAPGKAAIVGVTVWCYSSSNYLDLYYTTNATSPSWTPIVTGLSCNGSGAKSFGVSFTLGATTGRHAVRAQLRYGGTPSSCTTGNYNDHDDLTFQVGSL